MGRQDLGEEGSMCSILHTLCWEDSGSEGRDPKKRGLKVKYKCRQGR